MNLLTYQYLKKKNLLLLLLQGSRLSLDTGTDVGLKCTRSNATSLARLMGQDSDERPSGNLVKGNSMPSLR